MYKYITVYLAFYQFRADEEPVDPKKYLEESCKPKCVRYLRAYEVSHIEHRTCN